MNKDPHTVAVSPTKREFDQFHGTVNHVSVELPKGHKPVSAEEASRPYYRNRVKEARKEWNKANGNKKMVIIAKTKLS